MKYKKHIFICVNERTDGRKCCGQAHGMELTDAFKRSIRDLNLQVEIRAQRAGCLDVCAEGPAMVVYPEGVFYGNVQVSDVPEIVEEHLLNNRPVARLQMKFN